MSSMKIDHDAIRNLAVLLNETGLTEIEIAEADKRIRVTKSVTVQAYAPAAPAAAPAPSAPAASGTVVATAPENHPGIVKSPMVGTAYLAPAPDKPKFMTKGASVKEGDTLLIIEAMKVMNPIKAERSGKIVDILIGDGQPVEFGQGMVIIE